MVKAKKFNILGEMIGEVELPLSVFDVDVNSPKVLLHEVVTMFL
ncbi:MAG TPA: 50S ribosomal protein L4, partial [Candidatus Cloacimonas sp.]|nr:50S ribosomal protein L4 [Candidatus Cloacimonas sp.]